MRQLSIVGGCGLAQYRSVALDPRFFLLAQFCRTPAVVWYLKSSYAPFVPVGNQRDRFVPFADADVPPFANPMAIDIRSKTRPLVKSDC